MWNIAAGIVLCVLSHNTQANEIEYSIWRGNDVALHEVRIAELGSSLYHDYPYLELLSPINQQHIASERSLIVLAQDGETVIGAVTGMPAEMYIRNLQLVQQHEQYLPGKAIYIHDMMVDRPYQNRGIARKLLEIFEQEACTLGYTDAYLITVVRQDHPMKAIKSVDLDTIWRILRFTPTAITTPWAWKTRCGIPEKECAAVIDNMVRLWHKTLRDTVNIQRIFLLKQDFSFTRDCLL